MGSYKDKNGRWYVSVRYKNCLGKSSRKILQEHDDYIFIPDFAVSLKQTSKLFGTLVRAKYHLLGKNPLFFLSRFFQKSDTKTVPRGLRIQRKNEGNLAEIRLN